MGREPRTPVTVETPLFSGPIDLLLQLAHQGQVDLREIELGDLAERYLARARRELDLDEATDFLWYLSQLVELKARLLLPKPPVEEAPAEPEPTEEELQQRLEERLEEYRTFKEVAQALAELEAIQSQVFTRPPDAEPEPLPLEGLSIEDLFSAFRQVLDRATDTVGEIRAEPVTVAEKMAAIHRLLRVEREGLLFGQLFPAGTSTLEVVVTFLALLELIKRREVRVKQPKPFAQIRIFPREQG